MKPVLNVARASRPWVWGNGRATHAAPIRLITLASTLLLGLLLARPIPIHAAPAAHDLGQGLTYFRLTALPADLPTTSTASARVLDLRYATGDDSAGEALAAWLKFHASPPTPVLVLANASTAPALLRALRPAALPAGTLTLGVPAPDFAPDVAIKTTAETEHRAYDAFAAGTSLDALIAEKITKPRHDEAEMVRRQAAGQPLDPEPADDVAASASEWTATPISPAAPATPAPLIDATLQRAVHLHRALRALGR